MKLFKNKLRHSVTDELDRAVTFDDILLVPQFSDIPTRKLVDVRSELISGSHYLFDAPIVSSNMDTITGPEMAKAIHGLGGFGILHRYQTKDQTLKDLSLLSSDRVFCPPSIGIADEDLKTACEYMNNGHYVINIDIAHGDYKRMIEMIKAIKKESEFSFVIAGNVATAEGAKRLLDAGAGSIKVGIGPGSMCTTRVVTGHGVPQITAISEIAKLKKKYDFSLIADGGIRNSGDAVKALAFGADFVMLGSMLAGTNETPGKIFKGSGQNPIKYKVYRGMASREARSNFDPRLKNYTPEGVATRIPLKGPVSDIVTEMIGGIRSGLSYSGAWNLAEFRKKAQFMYVSAASYIEGTPHGKK